MDDDVEAMHVVFCPFSLLLSLCVLIVVRVYQTPIIAITANEHTHIHICSSQTLCRRAERDHVQTCHDITFVCWMHTQ